MNDTLSCMIPGDQMNALRTVKDQCAKKPRVLCLIDLQKCFLDGGVLSSNGAKDKIFPNMKAYFEAHNADKAGGGKGFFDVIVVTKDYHPEGHKSFTSTYQANDVNTDSGHALGISNWDVNSSFSMGLHPIPFNASMLKGFDEDEARSIFALLKEKRVLGNDNRIDGAFTVGGLDKSEATMLKDGIKSFKFANEFEDAWKEDFVGKFTQALDLADNNKGKKILASFLENYWPDHGVSGPAMTSGNSHEIDSGIVDVLAEYVSDVPVIALTKGESKINGESYSAGFTTDGFLASPFLKILEFLGPTIVDVCGTAIGYCPTGTARDTAKISRNTVSATGDTSEKKWTTRFLENLSKGVISEAEEGILTELKQSSGVEIVR
jgi:nicotinamidase-related amidase